MRTRGTSIEPTQPTRLSLRSLENFGGLAAIGWMIGVYLAILNAPARLIRFLSRFDLSSWPTMLTFLGCWLGIGLVLALMGLRSRWLSARIFAVAAICLFIWIAYLLVFPTEVPDAR